MKKCLLLLCAFICMVAYATDTKVDTSSRRTRKKVNSAIDNPSSYYGTQSLKKQRNDSLASSERKVQFNKDAFNPFARMNKK